MCGICGSIDFAANPSRDVVEAMVSRLRHRGPDSTGTCVQGSAGLGHARLSIIDLSPAGNQPMTTQDGRYTIVYNGEVYNFRELRGELEQQGFQFNSRTDTEVVLAAYAMWGRESFARLNGIFAFAIWDRVQRRVVLVRDRFGVKPLYFNVEPGRLVFASEVKAILAANPHRKWRLEAAALHELLFFGAGGLGRRTLFAGIEKLPAATWVELSDSAREEGRFWRMPEGDGEPADPGIAAGRVRVLLEAAVARQLVSDVPVGVFLSGGIDSSAVTAFASQHVKEPLRTYSVGFDFAPHNNELPKAAAVARHFGCNHSELFIRGCDLEAVIQELVAAHDDPFSDAANIPLYLLCREVRKETSVVLQGDGGDELFGGYRRYSLLRHARFARTVAGLVGPALALPISAVRRSRLDRMRRIWLERDGNVRMALLLAQDPARPPPTRVLGASLRIRVEACDPYARYREVGSELAGIDPVQKMLRTDAQILLPDIFLEKVDKATMAWGVEARVPFLDHALADYVTGLPADLKMKGGLKGLLKAALRGVVPSFVLEGKKLGFGVPYGRWLAGPLFRFAHERISRGNAVHDGLIEPRVAMALLDEHRAKRFDHGLILWKLLNLSLWYDRYGRHLVLE